MTSDPFVELLSSLKQRRRAVRFLRRFLQGELYALLATAALFVPARIYGSTSLVVWSLVLPTLLLLVLLAVDLLRTKVSHTNLLWDADRANNARHLLPAA